MQLFLSNYAIWKMYDIFCLRNVTKYIQMYDIIFQYHANMILFFIFG
jgi:hypothetical protein